MNNPVCLKRIYLTGYQLKQALEVLGYDFDLSAFPQCDVLETHACLSRYDDGALTVHYAEYPEEGAQELVDPEELVEKYDQPYGIRADEFTEAMNEHIVQERELIFHMKKITAINKIIAQPFYDGPEV